MRQIIVFFVATSLLASSVFAGEYGSGMTSDQQAMKDQVKTEIQARKETFSTMNTEERQAKFSGMRDKIKSRMSTHQPR